MSQYPSRRLIVVLLSALLLTLSAGAGLAQEGPLGNLPGPLANESAPSVIEGRWSAGCFPFPLAEGQDNGATLDFTFIGNRWQVLLSLFAEGDCTTPLFSLRREGPFAFQDASTVIDGATNMVFVGTQLGATAYNEEMGAFLSSAGCGTESFAVNEEQIVSDTGCIIFLPVAISAIEYDLIYFNEDGTLQLGARGDGDLSTPERRPTELNQLVLQRIDAE